MRGWRKKGASGGEAAVVFGGAEEGLLGGVLQVEGGACEDGLRGAAVHIDAHEGPSGVGGGEAAVHPGEGAVDDGQVAGLHLLHAEAGLRHAEGPFEVLLEGVEANALVGDERGGVEVGEQGGGAVHLAEALFDGHEGAVGHRYVRHEHRGAHPLPAGQVDGGQPVGEVI